jgi:hypothetical protein
MVRSAQAILIFLILLEHVIPNPVVGLENGGYHSHGDEMPWVYVLGGVGLLSVYALHQKDDLTRNDNFDIVIGGGFTWPLDDNLNVGPEVDVSLRFVRGPVGFGWSISFTEMDGGIVERCGEDLISADAFAMDSRLSLFLRTKSGFYGIGGVGLAIVTSDTKGTGFSVEGSHKVGEGWITLADGTSYHIGVGWISEKTEPNALRYFMEVRYVSVPESHVDAIQQEIQFSRTSLNVGVVF